MKLNDDCSNRGGFQMKKILPMLLALVFLTSSVSPALAKSRYKTYTVVEVKENTITLERQYYGETITETIDRSKRPDLKVGDRVRYEPYKKRLGKSLPSQ